MSGAYYPLYQDVVPKASDSKDNFHLSALDMGRTLTLKFGAPIAPASLALSDISGRGGNKEEPASPNSTGSALADPLPPTHT